MPSYVYWLLLAVSSILAALLSHWATWTRQSGEAKATTDIPLPRQFAVASPYTLVQGRFGWTLANPNDTYLGRAIVEYGEYGDDERNLLDQLTACRPGCVIEVGANAGFLTVPLAKTLAATDREMIVFEPQPFLFHNLCANLALSGLTNVRAWPYACGNQDTTLYFPVPAYHSPGNFGSVSMESEAAPDSVAVRCVRLDDMIGSQIVGLIKIDVEGAELDVLIGASKIIDTFRPIVFVENDRWEKSPTLIKWLMDRNYRLWWHPGALFNANNFFGNANNIYDKIISLNMLCFPAEFMPYQITGNEITDPDQHPAKPNKSDQN